MPFVLPGLLLAALVPPPLPLTFGGLLADRSGRLAPTAKLLDAAGRRVRLRGFVAELEMPPKGGFWLCPMPVIGDESGGGTADLPPESVFVIVRSSPRTAFHAPRGAVEVTGLLQVGPLAMPDGTTTHLRLLLDREVPKPQPAPRPIARPKARPVRSAHPLRP